MPLIKLNRLFLPLLMCLFIGTGCRQGEPSRAEFVLGTVCSISLYDQGKPRVYQEIFRRFREIENRMSITIQGTDVERVNANAGLEPVQVHDDVFAVIERALYFAEISGGAFDPTIGPLVSLWGIGGDSPRLPGQAEIDAALPLINWRDVALDREKQTVFLTRPGMALDLGAIAKGYAADEAAAIIRKARLKRAIVDLGGNVLTSGRKQDKSPWRIGVQNPLDSRGAYIGVLNLQEKTVVTSGVYERFFELDGQRYHHILSPADGYPARNDLLSVTIIAGRSMDADALSTAAFVLGYEKGRALLDSIDGAEAVFVFEDKSIRLTSGAEFTLTDDSYRIAADL
jgi:thiamine biosynthesis lipoprotein